MATQALPETKPTETNATIFIQAPHETLEACINAALNIHNPEEIILIVPRETKIMEYGVIPETNIFIVPCYVQDNIDRYANLFPRVIAEVPFDVYNDGLMAEGKHEIRTIKFLDALEHMMKEAFENIEKIVKPYKERINEND